MIQILTGDCMNVLPALEAQSVQCCVTSPPYWGLRDYGTAAWEGGDAGCDHKRFNGYTSGLQGSKESTYNGKFEKLVCGKCGARRIDSQLGLESTPEEYLAKMVAVFRQVWRVLRDDGTLWVNMGDSYAGGHTTYNGKDSKWQHGEAFRQEAGRVIGGPGLKPKDLCMMPARLAIALQADGWYLRSDIIWHKPNPMPESCTDRPTKSHEYIFLLAKNGGKPLIWKARDTGEWSYEPDLSEMITGSKKVLEGGGLSGWDSGPGAHTKLIGRYDLDEEDRIENQEPHETAKSRKARASKAQKSFPSYDVNGMRPDSELDEIPRWKGFDYFYDADAIREAHLSESKARNRHQNGGGSPESLSGDVRQDFRRMEYSAAGRNKRSVWTVATQPYAEAHFATFPEDLIKPCIMAGSRVGDTVLDPFGGSGTTGKVALELGRKAILIELNPAYVELARKRTDVTPAML